MAHAFNPPPGPLRIGVDVGGTFTDLVAVDDAGRLHVAKVPSTPGDFARGVLDAIGRVAPPDGAFALVHGSTVATNALLERRGPRVALLVTEGFGDLLLIGRQNRPKLYDLHPTRPPAVIAEDDSFPVRERTAAGGAVVTPLDEAALERTLDEIQSRGIRDLAVCLLFSFANPDNERRVAAAAARRGLTCTLSADVLPEFREYERASTTAINAFLRPAVATYLADLDRGLPPETPVQIMQSNGGTLSVREASESAVRLLLSGPAGGVLGASFVAEQAGHADVITYDMGGTSTDVATIRGARPEWTTRSVVDGLPVGVPLFDIHTIGVGGGSIAYVDAGGALRVGPRSAGANPGPACYGRGGTEPTVTDANVLLGRIPAEHFLGGAMKLRPDLAVEAVGGIARKLNKSPEETSLGILRVVESNMEQAVRAVTTRRGHDPRHFTLVSFGGAGGLHACRLADALDIPRVLIPPYCGVLSALGLVVAPPIADASKTVLHLNVHHDDSHLPAEFGYLSGLTSDRIPPHQTAKVEPFADVRFAGQSHELTVPIQAPTLENIQQNFFAAYEQRYGRLPPTRKIEVTTLRVRRTGHRPNVMLPPVNTSTTVRTETSVLDDAGRRITVRALNRAALISEPNRPGPFLLIDPEATAYVPAGWSARADERGVVLIEREARP